MWELVGLVAVVAVGSVVGPWVREAVAERKQRRYEAGESARIPVRARGPHPLPRRWAWGTVDTADEPLMFRRSFRGGAAVPITGLRLLRRELGAAPHAPEPLTVFRLRDGAGQAVDLAVHESHTELFEAVLHRSPSETAVPFRARRRVPWVQLALAGLAALWLAVWAYFAAAGAVVDARVLKNDDDYCDVEWTEAGRTYVNEVDCYGEQPGETVRVLTLPEPLRGEAAHLTETRILVPLLAFPFVVPLVLHGVGRLRRRGESPQAIPDALPAVVDEVAAPSLEAHDLRWSTIAATLERRAADEEWDLAASATWWERRVPSTLAQGVLRSLVRIVVPLAVIAFAVGFGWTAIDTARTFENANAVEIDATVEIVDGMAPPVPWDVEVAFEIDGHPEHVRVATLREPDEDDRLTIRYDPVHDVARPAEHDGTERGVLVVAIVVAIALGYLAWRVVKLVRVLVMFRRLRREPAEEMRYAVVLDAIGEAVMLLFETQRDLRPKVAVPFRHLPPMPVTGTVQVHGVAEDGAALLIRAGDRLLYPVAPAGELDTETLLWAVTGEEID